MPPRTGCCSCRPLDRVFFGCLATHQATQAICFFYVFKGVVGFVGLFVGAEEGDSRIKSLHTLSRRTFTIISSLPL